MKIECILIREGGSVVEIGGATYHFRPSAADGGKHVAVVNNPLHAARFISITEGYRMVDEPEGAAQAPPVQDPAEPPPSIDDMDRDALVAAHVARFGNKPHHKLSDAKLREILSAAE